TPLRTRPERMAVRGQRSRRMRALFVARHRLPLFALAREPEPFDLFVVLRREIRLEIVEALTADRDEAVGIDWQRLQSGSPNTRLAITFNCTSLVPPSIELAFERNH